MPLRGYAVVIDCHDSAAQDEGRVSRVVLASTEGNEFCVPSLRAE